MSYSSTRPKRDTSRSKEKDSWEKGLKPLRQGIILAKQLVEEILDKLKIQKVTLVIIVETDNKDAIVTPIFTETERNNTKLDEVFYSINILLL